MNEKKSENMTKKLTTCEQELIEQAKIDHDKIIIVETKFEELEKRVNENLLNRIRQIELAAALANEIDKNVALIKSDVSGLNTRLTVMESSKGISTWLVGGAAGLIVALTIIILEHLLGG